MTGQPAKHGISRKTRRRFLGGTFIALVGAAAATPMALAALPDSAPAEDAAPADGPMVFDETYRGRRIQGRPAPHDAQVHHHHEGGGPAYEVLVDGKLLHVMQNADGTWISVLNHYQTYAGLRSVARAAVDELDGAKLIPVA